MSVAGYRPLPVVPNGPRAFRYRIRRGGPLAAMVPAAMLGLAAVLLLRGNTSAVRGVAGFVAAVLAAPALLPLGIPLESGASRMLLGIGISAALWFLIGVAASLRATRSPVASWLDFWREYLWLAVAVWAGVVVALGVIQLLVGRIVV